MRTRTMKRLWTWAGRLLLVVSWACLSAAIALCLMGCSSLPVEWPVPDLPDLPAVVSNAVPVVVPQPATVEEWPAYRCDEWLSHGWEGENEMRASAVRAARAAGSIAIRCRLSGAMTDELAVHLLHFRHPARGTPENPWFMGSANATVQATAAGIERWVFECSGDRAALRRLLRDYDDGNCQCIIEGRVVRHGEL